jgi:hypothetical protein
MATFFTIWCVLCLFALMLMSLTDNFRLYVSDMLKFLIFKDLFNFLLSLLVLFVYLPLTITHLLCEVFRKK